MTNRPITLKDPTGHEGVPNWINSIINAINPFVYDTWFVSARFAAKHFIGVEGDITIYADMKSIKDPKVSINYENALSLGLSENLKFAVVVGSTKRDIDDVPGASLVVKDGINLNLAACKELCFGYLPGVDEKLKPETKAFLFGAGEGWDFSANLLEVSDYFVKVDKKGPKVQLPIFNRNFLKKLPIVGPIINRFVPE